MSVLSFPVYDAVLTDYRGTSGYVVANTPSGVNIRVSASAVSRKIVAVSNGSILHISVNRNGWSKLSYFRFNGWICSQYLMNAMYDFCSYKGSFVFDVHGS